MKDFSKEHWLSFCVSKKIKKDLVNTIVNFKVEEIKAYYNTPFVYTIRIVKESYIDKSKFPVSSLYEIMGHFVTGRNKIYHLFYIIYEL